jgi:spore maturation protein SpmB
VLVNWDFCEQFKKESLPAGVVLVELAAVVGAVGVVADVVGAVGMDSFLKFVEPDSGAGNEE